MASISARTGKLYFDFRYKGERCREYTKLEDNLPNRRRMEKILQRIEAEITLGTFVYRDYFPDSPKAEAFDALDKKVAAARLSPNQSTSDIPTFREFTEVWVSDMSVEWRESHKKTVMINLNSYVLPAFGEKRISDITKRSEEHTSELQSRENLVCRLLLEKKKNHHRMPVLVPHRPRT